MQLIYRGSSYELNYHTLTRDNPLTIAKFRGLTDTISHPNQLLIQPVFDFKYRDVSYKKVQH